MRHISINYKCEFSRIFDWSSRIQRPNNNIQQRTLTTLITISVYNYYLWSKTQYAFNAIRFYCQYLTKNGNRKMQCAFEWFYLIVLLNVWNLFQSCSKPPQCCFSLYQFWSSEDWETERGKFINCKLFMTDSFRCTYNKYSWFSML